jgi:multicomponent Na+:H+ antiporter subunit G
MNELVLFISWLSLLAGLLFFLSGSVGLVRFPDLFSRLHAVTKADTTGFGLITAGLICRAESWQAALLLVVIWLLVMGSGATNCQLLARYGEHGHPHMGQYKVRVRSQ